MNKLPQDITNILGDIQEDELRRFVVRLLPYIMDYISTSSPDGYTSTGLNYKWRESKKFLDARDAEKKHV